MPEIEVGDWVYKRKMARVKVDPIYEGPFLVTHTENFRAKLQGIDKDIGNPYVHFQYLRKYKGDPDLLNNTDEANV